MTKMKTENSKDKQAKKKPADKTITSRLEAKSKGKLVDKHFLFRIDGVTDGYVLGYN